MMELFYFIWVDDEDDNEDIRYVEAVVSNKYYIELDMWLYLN